MARAKLSDELKLALKQLSNKEKDKLIFRLLPKDQVLVHQLEFKLLEYEETTEERRGEVRSYISNVCNIYPEKYYSPQHLLWSLKDMSGKINYHVRVTKDKIGEIELNLFMLSQGISKNLQRLQGEDKWYIEKLAKYIAIRIRKLHGLIGKVHEDYALEFEDDIEELKKLITELPHIRAIADLNDIDLNLLSS